MAEKTMEKEEAVTTRKSKPSSLWNNICSADFILYHDPCPDGMLCRVLCALAPLKAGVKFVPFR
jgi:hypothetical protein